MFFDPDLAAYLAVLTITTLGSFFAREKWRRSCQSYSLFAWLNLVFVIYGGFWLRNIYDAERVVHGARLGISLGILCAVLFSWLLSGTAMSNPSPSPTQNLPW